MSKKLIAVASAAALALTGLVGIAPANATAATIAYSTAGGTGTVADPYTNVVPHANNIVAGTNALGITVSGLLAGDTVTVTSAGSAKVVGALLSASTLTKVTDYGAATLTKTVSGSSTTAAFYIYDTQIANASTLTIAIKETDAGVVATSSTTKYFKATVGTAHALTDVTVAQTVAASTAFAVTFKIKDVFGNEIGTSGSTISAALATTGAGVLTNAGIATYDTARKVYEAKMTSDSNTDPFIITLDGGTDASSNGLGATSLEGINIIINNPANPAAAAASATATAQIAALTAQLANSRGKDVSVTKKKYNALAKRWNSAFPGQKVALKQ